jgi:signal transduction histidine kinase
MPAVQICQICWYLIVASCYFLFQTHGGLLLSDGSSDQQLFLAALPPSQGQRRLAFGIIALLLIAFCVTAPFANARLSHIDPFIPIFETTILITDLITASLLFSQFFIVRRRALLVLASGYLFTALIVISHALTFPGVFAPTGLLGAGLQSTVWLYIFWHVASPLAMIAYVLINEEDSKVGISPRSVITAIGLTIAIVIAMVCGLTWAATAGNRLLPGIFLDRVQMNESVRLIFAGLMATLDAVGLVLLWRRGRSVLDLWLMVICCAWLFETMMAAVLTDARYSLGWYGGRTFGLIATFIVLLVLLSETTTIYAQLARSVMRRSAAREARQIAMDAMAASIAHEINQPLAAMITNANAGLRWLASTTPDLDEARASFKHIVDDGHRVNDVIGGIRSMFQKDAHGRLLLDANDLVRDVLMMLDLDLQNRRVSVATDLRSDLPQLLADRGQLHQVFLNLIMNAIEAMGSVSDRARVLRVSSDVIPESSNIVFTVEDTGTGVEGMNEDRIFEPFFTTKSAGTGIGLSICRSIIESHGGGLQACANKPYGTIFQVTLPSGG